MIDLAVRALFPEPPGADLVQAFRLHVATCGQPETFPRISTARPPKDGDLIVLHHPIDIDRRRRPESDMAPCPICSPQDPKYLKGGTLIWCDATSAVYAIGPKCSLTLWEDGRLNTAVNLFLQAEKEKQNAAVLRAELPKVAALRAWIASYQGLAEKLDRLHRSLAKDAPKLRGALSRALRTGTAATSSIKGIDFLRGGWNLAKDLSEADASLADVERAMGQDSKAFVIRLSATAVAQRLASLKAARATLTRTAERMAAAADFTARSNCEALGRLSKSESAPMNFKISHTASTMDLRSDAERWSGAVGIAPPSPVPA